ncbi:unnamed protein product [Mytilus edulis]|uniref:G-protein coupled receptors family 1 profile domain-containing protein n=1 Tax=Mytilus edulis TaxID=6550 RepID=A0A8S3VEU6_MYTED|nr:unnamed protein product [Mytilus edulis]
MSSTAMFLTTFDVSDTNQTTTTPAPRDGYDLPIYGLDNNRFISLHLTALSCISISLAFSVIVITFSFRSSNRRFFGRTKSERFVVYMALCDGLFNLAHSLDHLHILITKDHVRPRGLCVFYAFVIGEFISAQMFMVNIVSINAFSMIYMKKDMSFGKYDWRLLSFTFGTPFIVYLAAAILGKLGPTGAFCHFDAIKGADLWVYYLTILTFVVVVVNVILYIATWIKIYKDTKALANVLGHEAQAIKSIHNSARNISLFVSVFLIQWFSLAVYSITALLGRVPEVILYMVISLNNLGGVLNGLVFIILKRRRRKKPQKADSMATITISQSVSTISSKF